MSSQTYRKIEQLVGRNTEKNYIPNPLVEKNILGWSVFNTTFMNNLPTTITLSSANVNITHETASPLAGEGSLLFEINTASGSTGHGFISDVFTIEEAELAQLMLFSAKYKVVTGGSGMDFSGTSTQTLEAWVYNVGSAAWVGPYRGIDKSGVVGDIKQMFQSNWDSASNNNQYRVAIIVRNDPSVPAQVLFDDFGMGRAIGAGGNSIPVVVRTTSQTNNHTAGAGTVFAWDGVVWDTQNSFNPATGLFTAKESGYYHINYSAILNTGADLYFAINGGAAGYLFSHTAATNYTGGGSDVLYMNAGDNLGLYTNVTATMVASGFNHLGIFKIPTPVEEPNIHIPVSAKAGKVTTQNVPDATETVVQWDSLSTDTHGGFDLSTYKYVVKVSGDYNIHGTVSLANNSAQYEAYSVLYLNNSAVQYEHSPKWSTLSAPHVYKFDFKTYLTAGDEVKIAVYQSSGTNQTITNGIADGNKLHIEKVSGSKDIGPDQKVFASVGMSANQTTANVTDTLLTLDRRIEDSHGGLDLINGRYYAKVTGRYRFSGVQCFDANSTGVRVLYVRKNATDTRVCYCLPGTNAGGYSNFYSFAIEWSMVAGEYVDFLVYQSSGGNLDILASPSQDYTRIDISKV